MSVTVVPGVDILSRSYEVRLFPIFQPIAVGSLPATQEQGSADSVSCTVTVGAADDQGFVVMYDDQQLGPNGEADDPCGHAREIAGRIVAQLPPLTK